MEPERERGMGGVGGVESGRGFGAVVRERDVAGGETMERERVGDGGGGYSGECIASDARECAITSTARADDEF